MKSPCQSEGECRYVIHMSMTSLPELESLSEVLRRQMGQVAADYGRRVAVADAATREDLLDEIEARANDRTEDVGVRLTLTLLRQAFSSFLDATATIAVAAQQRRDDESQPLRRRVLEALSIGPARTSELADRFGSPSSSVSRVLTLLHSEGLVTIAEEAVVAASDGRARTYELTAQGEGVLHRTRANRPVLEPLDADSKRSAAVELARAYLDRAAAHRRRGDLKSSIPLAEKAKTLATSVGATELAIEAEGDLIATLRQVGGKSSRGEATARAEAMRRTRLKSNPGQARFAQARGLYELGRLAFHDSPPNRERAEDLIKRARDIYLAETDLPPAMSRRLAWCHYSLASIYRDQWRVFQAVEAAFLAEELFDDVDDTFGEASTAVLLSECRRLARDYAGASNDADRAIEISEKHGYERCKAIGYLQHGEIARCLGNGDEAELYLAKSIEMLEPLGLKGSLAFAYASYGALAFDRGNYDRAINLLATARKLAGSAHPETRALSLRRMGAAFRERNGDGDMADARRFFNEARRIYSDQLRSPVGLAETILGLALVDRSSESRQFDRRIAEAVLSLREMVDELNELAAPNVQDDAASLLSGWTSAGVRLLGTSEGPSSTDRLTSAEFGHLGLRDPVVAVTEMSLEPIVLVNAT